MSHLSLQNVKRVRLILFPQQGLEYSYNIRYSCVEQNKKVWNVLTTVFILFCEVYFKCICTLQLLPKLPNIFLARVVLNDELCFQFINNTQCLVVSTTKSVNELLLIPGFWNRRYLIQLEIICYRSYPNKHQPEVFSFIFSSLYI